MSSLDKRFSFSLPDMDFCLVEGSEFLMGDDNGEFHWEKPAHKVRLSTYCIGKYPVTQRLWKEVMGNDPSRFRGSARPVESVSWEEARHFVNKLNKMTGESFRLPTEAEWEYAARGGRYSQGYQYAGSDKLKQVGWNKENSNNETKEAGLLFANELGIYDMSGNVFEWCSDWFAGDYYQICYRQEVVENPRGPDEGELRVLRGGSSFDDPVRCRVVFRLNALPESRNDNIGFRLVLPFKGH